MRIVPWLDQLVVILFISAVQDLTISTLFVMKLFIKELLLIEDLFFYYYKEDLS